MMQKTMKGSNSTIMIYDGSFAGLLTVIFECFERRLLQVAVVKEGYYVEELFSTPLKVITDEAKSNRVWKGIRVTGGAKDIRLIFRAFLSENDKIEEVLLGYIRHLFDSKRSVSLDHGNHYVNQVVKINRSIEREAHRMEAFVRFKLTKDNIYFANIEPDFNVLPLVSKHFERRYADQKWIIYDLRRNYGLYYDLESVETIVLKLDESFSSRSTSFELFDQEEGAFQQLWKDYFKSTNIKSRKNTKLHVRHVPKRYWKYLMEKEQ